MTNASSKVVSALFMANAVWHGLAVFYFIFKPRGILNKYTHIRPVSEQASDILKFLGAMNSGYFLLAILGFIRSYKHNQLRTTDLWVLALGNFSQFVFDLIAHSNGRWKTKLLQITIPDGVFSFLNAACALLTVKYSS